MKTFNEYLVEAKITDTDMKLLKEGLAISKRRWFFRSR